MCGISGVLHFNSKVQPAQIEAMNNLIKHRGPDDEGFVFINTDSGESDACFGNDTIEILRSKLNPLENRVSANLAFGFRRLSIVDLSENGHQPMSAANGNYWITFNGEVYNHIELREELKSEGYTFRSKSDTEVILTAYRHWGTECVTRFNGMWAFAIWDNKTKILFASRDRLGIKPFYYYKDSNSFFWGSEPKQLVKTGLVEARPNYHTLNQFLLNVRQNVSNDTFFEDIVELPAGHNLIVTNDVLDRKQYWEIIPDLSFEYKSESEVEDEFRRLFIDAVKLRMRSDVPIGISLSGGLDSGSIASVATKLTDQEIQTFSVYFENEKKYDEREYITEVLKQGKFKPTYFTSDGNISVDDIRKMAFYHDEPVLGASPFSAYQNHKNISKANIRVILNGQGGDEILAGYHYYFKYYYLDLLKSGNFSSLFSEIKTYQNSFNLPKRYYFSLFLKLGLRLIASDRFLKRFEKYEMSTQSFYTEKLKRYSKPLSLANRFRSELDNNLYNTLKTNTIPHLLHWEDRNSMANSVESRVPFLDYRLIEFMFKLPGHFKLKGADTKILLRRAMKGILPEKVRTRKDKIGFVTPTGDWSNGPLFDSFSEILSSKTFGERGIFNQKEILNTFKHKKHTLKTNEIWSMVSTELWFREFIDRIKNEQI